MLSDQCYSSLKRYNYVYVWSVHTQYIVNEKIISCLYRYIQKRTISDTRIFTEVYLYCGALRFLALSLLVILKHLSKPEQNDAVLSAPGTELVGPRQVALRTFSVSLTQLVWRQRLDDVNFKTSLAWPHLLLWSSVSHIDVTCHTYLSLSSLGALLHISAWHCVWAWPVANQGLVLTTVWAGRTRPGGIMQQESPLFTIR